MNLTDVTNRAQGSLKTVSGLVEAMVAEIAALRKENADLRKRLRENGSNAIDVELDNAKKAERLKKLTIGEFYRETYYDFGSYIYNALLRGFDGKEDTPMEELLSCMPSQLASRFRGIGIRKIKELVECLRRHGLELAQEKDMKFLKKMEENGIV